MSSTTDLPPTECGPAPEALIARQLKRRFAGTEAVSELSLEVKQGELYGLVGPDGAGKTTALRMMAGVLKPDSGEVRVCGLSLADGSLEAREALGYMPQQYSLYPDLTVAENLFFSDVSFRCHGRSTPNESNDSYR
ncbi:MAG: ATP-binding cassette domain-containing protein [Pseudomonadota bacterium]